MDDIEWTELKELVKGAEMALISGQLNEWQHADCTSFHVLATAIMDLHHRLAEVEATSDQPVDDWPDEDFDDGK